MINNGEKNEETEGRWGRKTTSRRRGRRRGMRRRKGRIAGRRAGESSNTFLRKKFNDGH